MDRLLNYLKENSIVYSLHNNYIQICNLFTCEYIRIFKLEHPIYDYLYCLIRPKENNRVSTINYAYLVNIYIPNFLSEK